MRVATYYMLRAFCVGLILTTTAAAQEHIPFDWPRQSGAWTYQDVPEAVIEPGQTYEGVAIGLNGVAHYAGWELFYDRPPAFEKARLEIYRSPNRRYLAVGDRRDTGDIVQVAIIDMQADPGPEAITLNGGVVMGPMVSPLRPQADVRIQPGIAFAPDSDVALARAYISVGDLPSVEALVWTHMSTGQIGESLGNFYEGGDFQTDIARTRSSTAGGGEVTVTIKRRDCGYPCEEAVVEHTLPAEILRDMTFRMPLPVPRAVVSTPDLARPEASEQVVAEPNGQIDDQTQWTNAMALAAEKPSDGEPIQNTNDMIITFEQLRLTASFLDPDYEAQNDSLLLGLHLSGDDGTNVLAPVSGIIISNSSGTDVNVDKRWLILRDTATGKEHLFGQLISSLEPGQGIQEGDLLGQVADDSDGNRIHWGINRLGVWQAVDTASGWGWGHGPATASAEQALARGWVDPTEHFLVRSSETPERSVSAAADETPWNIVETVSNELQDNQSADVEEEMSNGENVSSDLSLIERYFTSALGVDSDYVQLQLIDAGFYTGDLAPFGPNGRHSLWTPKVRETFQNALEYARNQNITYDLASETGYYAFVDTVRKHRMAELP